MNQPATAETLELARPTDQYERRPRATYEADQLRPLIAPRAIAIIGVSDRSANFGYRTIENLRGTGYAGTISLVHPRHAEICGVRCWPSIEEVPGPIDCVIVSVPADGVVEQVRRAAAAGARSVLIYTAGFAEVGDEGRAAQMALKQIALEYGIPVCGPNTGGMLNFVDNVAATFFLDVAHIPAKPDGRIALISQSTGLGFQLAFTRVRGNALSYCLTCGNSVDVNITDLLAFAIDDPHTAVIGVVFEGMDAPREFIEVAMRAKAMGKPVIAMRVGSSKVGGAAAASHTGSLAAPHRLYQAAFRKAGIVEVSSSEQLLDTAMLFSRAPHCKGGGAGIIASSGGVMVMAVDAAERHGVPLPDPAESTRALMREKLPAFASAIGNPTDLTAGIVGNPALYAETIGLFSQDPEFAAVVVPVTLSCGPSTTDRPLSVIAAAQNSNAAVCALWVSGWLEGPGSELLDNSEVPFFRSTDRCFAALSHWLGWHATRNEVRVLAGPANKARFEGTGLQSESRSREILGDFGIHFAPATLVANGAEAASAALEFGGPVVVKIDSAHLAHRFKAGAVMLDVIGSDAVAAAYRQVVAAGQTAGADSEAVLVAPMVRGGVELMIGAHRDPRFGPTVICSVGGVMVEELDDAVAALAPLNRIEARTLLNSLRIGRVLVGDTETSHGDSLIDMIVAVSHAIAADNGIAELDLNPVLVDPRSGSVQALDALIVLQPLAAD
jgi:acyl-CoA synthetase (NDP forming)